MSKTVTALAVRERTAERFDDPGETTWHLPGGPPNDDYTWQAIACSEEEGLLPCGQIEVPLDLTGRPGERWCPDCRTLLTAAPAA